MKKSDRPLRNCDRLPSFASLAVGCCQNYLHQPSDRVEQGGDEDGDR
ncbi:MAG: hypothetical protein MH252_08160 [Thermosynechococcaceae cyanobacterium MS004]|nr:hypothetical protein [Thermosynechococcaceae cyanobacterium MS004]